jgi:UDP-N-acetylglucosamine 2-epimerase (hydrolysing)
LGSHYIIGAYQKLKDNARFRIFPSLRFEYFLTLLKHAQFIIGNSSAGIREAPYYGIPIINIGTRQQNRAVHADILNVGYDTQSILAHWRRLTRTRSIPIRPILAAETAPVCSSNLCSNPQFGKSTTKSNSEICDEE